MVRNKEKCDIGHPCEKITASWTKFSIAYDVDYWRTETKRQNYTHDEAKEEGATLPLLLPPPRVFLFGPAFSIFISSTSRQNSTRRATRVSAPAARR